MYCLTNEHCVTRDYNYGHVEYTVIDAYGNQHAATLVKSSVEYDLAILRFALDGALSTSSFAESDAGVGDITVSVGAPDGLINTVTYGELLGYRAISDLATSGIEVTFPVGVHTTPVDHGSSGGPVYNIRREIVGINFAASEGENGEITYAYYIPVSRVFEFLNEV